MQDKDGYLTNNELSNLLMNLTNQEQAVSEERATFEKIDAHSKLILQAFDRDQPYSAWRS